jgi:hypothetical protein
MRNLSENRMLSYFRVTSDSRSATRYELDHDLHFDPTSGMRELEPLQVQTTRPTKPVTMNSFSGSNS